MFCEVSFLELHQWSTRDPSSRQKRECYQVKMFCISTLPSSVFAILIPRFVDLGKLTHNVHENAAGPAKSEQARHGYDGTD
jgi:hypothetical protein